ncbi:acyl-CoA dehydrogenase family protein [Amycolatopsis nivea]|uniref:acyl-CoA dehydrogenase family protein n=1 Tax=Amycolatopsis nivea TaxID=1644109 RepID=UPI00106F1F79|nr:acyl-CoA dehydrogenase family protein [Amycolatopsis nivea]
MDPMDPAGVSSFLSEDEVAVRDTVRQFIRERFLPNAGRRFESGEHDREFVRELGRLGVLAMHLDGYGFGGASVVQYGLVCAELEAGDSGIRQYASGLPVTAIHKFGSDDQKNRYLPGLATGDLLAAYALTEPDVGSNPVEMRTRARRDGKDWIIDGAKTWITNGHTADVTVVWAVSDDGIRAFLVSKDTPGFTARPIPSLLSMRVSATSELSFDGVRVPEEAELPGVRGRGLSAAFSCLTYARLGILFGAAGAARSCLEAAVDYATTRTQFGKPIGSFQLTQRKLSQMAIQVAQSQLLALHIGRAKDAGTASDSLISMGKVSNAKAALEVARTARSVLGANGISLEYPVMRHLANLEAVNTYEGTEEMHTLIIGRALTGLSAFK